MPTDLIIGVLFCILLNGLFLGVLSVIHWITGPERRRKSERVIKESSALRPVWIEEGKAWQLHTSEDIIAILKERRWSWSAAVATFGSDTWTIRRPAADNEVIISRAGSGDPGARYLYGAKRCEFRDGAVYRAVDRCWQASDGRTLFESRGRHLRQSYIGAVCIEPGAESDPTSCS